MKKLFFSVAAVVIAIASVAFAKANPNALAPACPEGTVVFYFVGDSESLNDQQLALAFQDDERWTRIEPIGGENCGGIIRVCAICVPADNPGDPAVDQTPDLSGSEISTKLSSYISNRDDLNNESETDLFYEKN